MVHMTVLNFDQSRRSPAPLEPSQCPCGSSWFELRGTSDESIAPNGAVAISQDGTVVAYAGEPHCLECGLSLYADSSNPRS